MSGVMQRTLSILELLANHPAGLPLARIATALMLPASATHRMLTGLCELGYVRQLSAQGDYALTIRLAALGLGYLGRSGIGDIAQPVLDDLASRVGELVRLAVVDGGALHWVGAAQGATSGLRYDPAREQGGAAPLVYSATGRAWLASLTDAEAMAQVAAQGLTPPDGAAGPPIELAAVPALLDQTRARGYALAVDTFLTGMAAMAVPVMETGRVALGCVSIAGPSTRLTAARMLAVLPLLQAAADQIAAQAAGSSFFRQRV